MKLTLLLENKASGVRIFGTDTGQLLEAKSLTFLGESGEIEYEHPHMQSFSKSDYKFYGNATLSTVRVHTIDILSSLSEMHMEVKVVHMVPISIRSDTAFVGFLEGTWYKYEELPVKLSDWLLLHPDCSLVLRLQEGKWEATLFLHSSHKMESGDRLDSEEKAVDSLLRKIENSTLTTSSGRVANWDTRFAFPKRMTR